MNLFIINDISKKIFSLLTDKEFCYFVTTSDKYYKYYSRFKVISKKYDLSKIMQVRETYMFINIYYDLNFWQVTNISSSVQIITFHDFFNDELVNVDELPSLTHIYPGLLFTNCYSVNQLKHLQNYKDIVANVISNIISINNNCELSLTNVKSSYLNGNKFTILTWIRIINGYIQGEDIHNYETRLNNFINKLRSNDEDSFYDLIQKFDFFKSYPINDILALSKLILRILEHNDKFITTLTHKYCGN